jgi:hypothetical protein
MDHVTGGQVAGRGDDGLPYRAAALAVPDPAAVFQDGRSTSSMDRSVHATTAQQGSVGCVDDGIYLYFGDIAFEDMYTGIDWMLLKGKIRSKSGPVDDPARPIA